MIRFSPSVDLGGQARSSLVDSSFDNFYSKNMDQN